MHLLCWAALLCALSEAASAAVSPALWMPFGRIGYILRRLSTFDARSSERGRSLSPIPADFRSNNGPHPSHARAFHLKPIKPSGKGLFAHIIQPERVKTTTATTTTSTTTPVPTTLKRENCAKGAECRLSLRSFETQEPAFEYAYAHSTPIGPLLAQLFDSTMGTTLPGNVDWRRSMGPEVAQLMMNLMRVARPNRVLVVGVFTGFGVVAASTGINERGVVVGVESPGMANHWNSIGQKYAQQANLMSRIQIKADAAIPETLTALGRSEPGSFDMIILDDLTLENYLVDYERCLILLRSGGLLLINDAFARGEVIAERGRRSSKGDILDQLNRKLRTDPRVTATFLPFSDGLVFAVKN